MSPTQTLWRTLHESGGDTLILTVDFAATGRTQAGFPELVAAWRPEHTVLAAQPPADAAGRRHDDDGAVPGASAYASYTELLIAELPGTAPQVTAVLGYCAGAVYAADLADSLARRQRHAPRLVVLDPELPSAKGLYEDYERSGAALAGLLEPEDFQEFQAAGRRAQDAHPDDDLARVGPALAAAYTRAVHTAAERLDLDDDIRDELAGSFIAYVHYLTAASRHTPDPALPLWAAHATAITSTAPEHPVAREIRIAATRDDLLRSADTVRALTGLLAAPEVTRT